MKIDSLNNFPASVRASRPRRFCGILCLLAFLCQLFVPTANAASPASDAGARSYLFGDESRSNSIELRRQTVRLTQAQRYPFLLDKVLPPGTDEVQISVDFAPTNPTGWAIAELGLLEESHLLPLVTMNTNRPTPRQLLSPAIDLVESARQIRKLNELRDRVNARHPELLEQKKSQLALLALIELAAGNFEEVSRRIIQLYDLANQLPIELAERPAEAVVVWTGLHHPETVVASRELAVLLYEQARNSLGPRSERWHRHVYALKYLFDWRESKKYPDDSLLQPQLSLKHWRPVSRQTAETCGKGYPVASWETGPGEVRRVSNHDHDYLYYAVPLTGDYELEATLSTFSYHEIQLAAGNVWAGPGYDLKACLNGNFRNESVKATIDPQLSPIGNEMRARLVARDGKRITYINGRQVFETEHSRDSDPWVGLHSVWFSAGFARDLRISGSPVIPAEIHLAKRADLPGWIPYYNESAGKPDSDWRLESLGDDTVLIGRSRTELVGSFQESLLRYHRPMWEDGTLEYEFYYEPGRFDVHPALGRTCFYLAPAGVGVHEITDGNFERTGLSPTNFSRESNQIPATEALPLRPADWNHLRLELTGQQVTVTLNETPVYKGELEPENLRSIGLFHYSDYTEARVRNLRWRGAWPKSLPQLTEQELADATVDNLIEVTEKLPVLFEHDFSAGNEIENFYISGEGWEQHFETLPNGLRVTRPAGQYAKDMLSVPLSIEGDFDITLEFEDFRDQVTSGGEANLQLSLYFDDLEATECRLYRKHLQYSNGKHEQLIRAASTRLQNGRSEARFLASPAEESTSGRMRLIRHDDQLYYLFASADSPHFRLFHQREITLLPLILGGVKCVVMSHKDGFSSVVFKHLTVRATSASRRIEQPMPAIAELDEQRDKLTARKQYKFDDKLPFDEFNIWGAPETFERTPDGWIVDQPGFDQWQAKGIASAFTLEGDFDIAFALDVVHIEPSAPNGESTVFLHAGFASERPSALETKFSTNSSGTRDIEMQLNSTRRNGSTRFDELQRLHQEDASLLRIARRNGVAYVIYQSDKSAPQKILGRVQVGNDAILPGNLWALVHTGGSGRKTVIRYRELNVYAEKLITPNPPK